MEPVSLIVVSVTALAAAFAKSVVQRLLGPRHEKPEMVQVVTASGQKITIDAAKLTPEKAAEIAGQAAAAKL